MVQIYTDAGLNTVEYPQAAIYQLENERIKTGRCRLYLYSQVGQCSISPKLLQKADTPQLRRAFERPGSVLQKINI